MNTSHAHPSPVRGAPRVRDAAAWILGAALVVGLVRFVRLGAFGLWLDEALTWADYHHALDGQISNPLGYLLVGWTTELLGGVPTEPALRLLPALFGWLCVPLTYWAFRSAAGRERAAVAALLVAVAMWHVFWSQSARFYTFAQATTLVGAGLWLRALMRGSTVRAVAGLLVVGAAVLFHPTSAFLLVGLVVAPFVPRILGARLGPASERVALHIGLIALLCGLAALPWGWNWVRFHAAQKPLADPAHLVLTAAYHFTPLLLAAGLLGSLLAIRRLRATEHEPEDRFVVVAAGVALVAFGVALGLSLMAQMTAQYVFVLLPWVALLAGSLAVRLADAARGARVSIAVTLLLAAPALAETGLLMTQGYGGRARWREAYEFVAEARRPGELLVGHASKLGELYLGQGRTDLRNPVRVSMLNYYFTQAPRHWNRHERGIWFVYRPQWLAELLPEDQIVVERFLREECRLIKRFPVNSEGRELDLEIYHRP